jgi:hypothetical protein
MKSNAEKLSGPREIWLVHHTHVDIGYTGPQETVMRKHADYIRSALDLCSASDHFEPEAKFRWTCEGSWTAKTFLERHPERADEFFRRVREGRIELTALYFQVTDLFSEALLEEALSFAADLARKEGLPLTCAMNSDTAGWGWCLPGLFSGIGVKYFDVASNSYRAPCLSFRRRPLRWLSPGGEPALVWVSDGYMTGNYLLKSDGVSFDAEKIASFLKQLEDSGYPHNKIAVRTQGAPHDNAPPGEWLSRGVRDWNLMHDNPRLKIVTSGEWMSHLNTSWPEPVPEFRAAWPDWWADGHGGALYESSLARAVDARLKTLRSLKKAGAAVDDAIMRSAVENLMFFCEHTWGSWASVDEPDSFDARTQWNRKACFVYTASARTDELLANAMRSLARKDAGPGVFAAVFNPLSFERDGVAEFMLRDSAVTGEEKRVWGLKCDEPGPELHLLEEASGATLPVCREPVIMDSARNAGQRVRFMARGVPAGGSRLYRVVPGPAEPAPDGQSAPGGDDLSLHGAYFSLKIDRGNGGVSGLRHNPGKLELVRSGGWTLNQIIRETAPGPDGLAAFRNWRSWRSKPEFSRESPRVISTRKERLPWGSALTVESALPGVFSVSAEYRLFDSLPLLEIRNTVRKACTEEPEALYAAFPFALSNPEVFAEVAGGPMRPGVDQIPGTSADWHGIQRYFAVSGAEGTVYVCSPDVPLIQVNGINTGSWLESLPPHNGTVMSYAANNYWNTNFPAGQGGPLTFRYSLFFASGGFDAGTAARFASGVTQPLAANLGRGGGRAFLKLK